jgi:Xaa-Pro dipeptidase
VGIGIKELYAEGADHTEDLVCMSGENTNPYCWTFTDRMIRPGDLVYVDVDGASYQGYKTCIYRTFCCGRAREEQKSSFLQRPEMLPRSLSACVMRLPTTTCSRSGPTPRLLGLRDLGRCEPACLRPRHRSPARQAHDLLHPPGPRYTAAYPQSGMVMAFETYNRQKGKDGVRIEDMVLVTEDGYELLSLFPQELIECWLPY